MITFKPNLCLTKAYKIDPLKLNRFSMHDRTFGPRRNISTNNKNRKKLRTNIHMMQ